MREACPEPETVGAYVEGGLGPYELDSFYAHLAECDDCRLEVTLVLIGQASPDVSVPVPDELRARVVAAGEPVEGIVEGCPDSQTIAAYIEERLDPEENSLLIDHIGNCDDCRREIALIEMERNSSQLSRAVPPELRARVIGAGSRGTRRLRTVRHAGRPHFAAIAAAAAAVLLAIILVLNASNGPNSPRTGPSPVVKNHDEPLPVVPPQPAPDPKREAPAPKIGPEPVPPDERPPEPPPEWTPPEPPRSQDTPVAPAPQPKPAPEREPVPTDRVRETVALRFGAVKITDISGDLTIRRKGKDKREKVTAPVVVSEGDMLIAERGGANFLLDDYPVTLMPQTQLGVAYEVEASAPVLVLDRGEALVDSSAAAARWYVSTKNVSVWIDQTHAKFAAAVESQGLGLTALSGHLTGRDDFGRPFDLRGGEKLVTSPRAASTAPDPEAPKKAAMLVASRPLTNTIFSTGFDAATLAGVTILDGAVERQGEFLSAVEKKGLLSATIRLPKELHFHSNLVVRLRVRTNIEESKVVLMVEEHALLTFERKLKKEQRQSWMTVEFALGDPDVKLRGVKEAGAVVRPTDKIVTVGVTGFKRDVFGDERPYLQIDDVQIAMRGP